MTSKRNVGNNAAASLSAPPPSILSPPRNYCDDQGVRERWPVLIYRLQSHRGWEVYSDDAIERRTPPPAARSSSNNGGGGRGGGTMAGAAATEEEELTAAPREGCIEVRKMRLRIRLFEQHLPWDRGDRPSSSSSARAGTAVTDEYDRDARGDVDIPGSDGWNDNALLVRRRNTLLITTRRGRGAVVLRFASTRDCVDFCDRLVYLNRRVLLAPPLRHGYRVGDYNREAYDEDADAPSKRRYHEGRGISSGVIVSDERRREHRIDESNDAKRRRLTALGNDRDDCSRRRESIVNYIVQLAHSEEFRGFVDEIERGLEFASDTAAIHAALGF